MWIGTILVLLAAGGYSMLPILIKLTYEHTELSPTDLVLWRFILAVIVTWGLLLARRELPEVQKLSKKQISYIMGIGTLFSFAALTAFIALDEVPATTFTVLVYTYPAMVALLSLMLGESLAMIKWIAIGLTLIGCILTAGGKLESGSLFGMALVVINAGLYAVYLVLSSRNKVPLSGVAFGTISMTGTLLALLPIILVEGLRVPTSLEGWVLVLALVLFSTVLPILTMLMAMQRIGASNAAIISTVEPVITVLLAAIILGERVTDIQYVGAAVIFVSVIMLQIPARKPKPFLATNPSNPQRVPSKG